jgi:hypothetical protein
VPGTDSDNVVIAEKFEALGRPLAPGDEGKQQRYLDTEGCNNGWMQCVAGSESDTFQIDPEFEAALPRQSEGELGLLYERLDRLGCREALEVWKGHNILVDGMTRMKHFRQRREVFYFVELEFADREAVKDYIIKKHLGRRNLSRLAESYLCGQRYLAARNQGARNDLAPGEGGAKGRLSEHLAREFGRSEKSIRRDAEFTQAVDGIVANCGTEAKGLLLAKGNGLAASRVLREAKKDAEAQRQFIAYLKEHGKPARKARTEQKAKSVKVLLQPLPLVRAVLKLKGKALARFKKLLASQEQKRAHERNGHRNGRCKAATGESGPTRSNFESV